jgi:uncharacterized protein
VFIRDIENELVKWKNSTSRKPLLLRGARQVGKTTVIDMFSRHYKHYIKLNLEEADKSLPFTEYGNAIRLVEQIFFLHNIEIKNIDNTLLFIDEIQEVPGALNMLRYFYEQVPQLHVIAAGSLLETAIKGEIKIPVGRVEYKIIRPVSFHEFLEASGESIAAKELLNVPIKEYTHNKLLNLFHIYTLIGGMPEIVNNYIKNRDLVTLKEIYTSLVFSYIEDVEKYGRNNNLIQVIRHVIRAGFLEAGNRIKFHGFGNSSFNSREVSEAMQTLQKVMLLHLIYPTTNTAIPVIPDKKKSPRLQVLDTGMLNHFAGLQNDLIGTKNLDTVYRGKIAEHIVGQEILASKYNILNELNFWVREKSNSNAEVDFVIGHRGLIIPIEVKSGPSGTLRSLHSFMDAADHHFAIRLYNGVLKIDKVKTLQDKEYSLLNLPYYLAGKVENYIDWMMDELSS